MTNTYENRLFKNEGNCYFKFRIDYMAPEGYTDYVELEAMNKTMARALFKGSYRPGLKITKIAQIIEEGEL